ncbi:MAG: HD domain-containing protein [Pseudomonadota bacterium]
MAPDELQGRVEFLRRAEGLKDTLRSAYTREGRVESVADHTWRLCLFAITFADLMPEVDVLKLLKMCLLHDLGEVVDGDIPAPEQANRPSKSDKERRDFESVIESLPEMLRTEFLILWDDYEYVRTNEAIAAKAIDKLETILQHNQGDNPRDFDYRFNLDYGRRHTDKLPLTTALRDLFDAETENNARKYQD